MDRVVRTQTVSIANGASLSSRPLSVGERGITAIVMPDAWTAANLTFQVSVDGVTYQNLYDESGTEVTVTAAASRTIRLDPGLWVGLNFIKIRSGTAGVPVNQGAARSIVVSFRGFA